MLFFLIEISIISAGSFLEASSNVNSNEKSWHEYSNHYYPDYVISHPSHMKVSEKGQNNRRAIISTQDYKINMVNGAITSGFKINIYVSYYKSLDNLFYCNKESFELGKDCLLADANTELDYQNGKINIEEFLLNGHPGIKYKFISSIGKNNNIGFVAKRDDKYYIVLIAYRKHRDIKLFKSILNSFKFKE